MDQHVDALRASVARLRELVTPLGPDQLESSAYPTEWSIADVVSHVGSSALISLRRIDDGLGGTTMPDDFAPGIWAEWDAKSPAAKAADGLAADRVLLARIESFTPEEIDGLSISMGPMSFDAARFVASRLSEHVMHTWDVEVALDDRATLPSDATELIVDDVELLARYTARATGVSRSITVATIDPARAYGFELAPEGVTVTKLDAPAAVDLTMPAEAFVRLVYGRLDADHTPELTGDGAALHDLRATYPGF
jgi:uncharacterized protein (TIGR03083 family)